MRDWMRWIFLVAGLAVGYALGMSSGGPERVAHRVPELSSRGAPDVSAHAPSGLDAPPAVAVVQDRTVPAGTASSDAVIEPTEDAEDTGALSGDGRLEVDFGKIPSRKKAWVAIVTMRGGRDEQEFSAHPPESVAAYEGSPGVHEVWWLDGPRRIGTRVNLVAGQVVRLRASDFDAPYIPAGLAVLAVRVHTTWGGTLRHAGVTVRSPSDGESVRTDEHGCANITVRPGPYTLEIGDSKTSAVATAGRETLVEIQPSGEGDVLFDPCAWVVTRRVQLRRRDGGQMHAFSLLGGANGNRMGFAYVAEGEYDVVRQYAMNSWGGVPLGSVRVYPGRTSRVALEIPPGKLTVNLTFERPRSPTLHTVVLVQRLIDGVAVKAQSGQVQASRVTADNRSFRTVIDGLWPGTYRVFCVNSGATVEVGETPVTVELRVP